MVENFLTQNSAIQRKVIVKQYQQTNHRKFVFFYQIFKIFLILKTFSPGSRSVVFLPESRSRSLFKFGLALDPKRIFSNPGSGSAYQNDTDPQHQHRATESILFNQSGTVSQEGFVTVSGRAVRLPVNCLVWDCGLGLGITFDQGPESIVLVRARYSAQYRKLYQQKIYFLN